MMSTRTIVASLIFFNGYANGCHISDCSFKKEVGNDRYTLVKEEDVSAWGCESNCIYTSDSDPSERFCFKTGNLPFHCMKEHDDSCPKTKLVGGKDYTLTGNSYKNISNCSSTCIYEKDEIPRSKFCFDRGEVERSINKDDAIQFCHEDMKEVLDDMSVFNHTVYCCNNAIITSTQCGGLGPPCKDVCGNITCVKLHPKPETQSCSYGEISLRKGSNDIVAGGMCKTIGCGTKCACCVNRGFYLTCRKKVEESCRCSCQCKKYNNICGMKTFCGKCKRYKHSNCPNREPQQSADTCPEGLLPGKWAPGAGNLPNTIELDNLEDVIDDYDFLTLFSWNFKLKLLAFAVPSHYAAFYSAKGPEFSKDWCASCPGTSIAGAWKTKNETTSLIIETLPNKQFDECSNACSDEKNCVGANWNVGTVGNKEGSKNGTCILLSSDPTTFNLDPNPDEGELWCAL